MNERGEKMRGGEERRGDVSSAVLCVNWVELSRLSVLPSHLTASSHLHWSYRHLPIVHLTSLLCSALVFDLVYVTINSCLLAFLSTLPYSLYSSLSYCLYPHLPPLPLLPSLHSSYPNFISPSPLSSPSPPHTLSSHILTYPTSNPFLPGAGH